MSVPFLNSIPLNVPPKEEAIQKSQFVLNLSNNSVSVILASSDFLTIKKSSTFWTYSAHVTDWKAPEKSGKPFIEGTNLGPLNSTFKALVVSLAPKISLCFLL